MSFEESHCNKYSILSILKFNVLLMGLYENSSILPNSIKENNISDYTLKKAYFKVISDSRNSIHLDFEQGKGNKNEVYGTVNYGMIRGIFYDNEAKNNDFIRVFYEYENFKSNYTVKDSDVNVRCVELIKDDGNALYLVNNYKNVYMDMIGRTIINEYSNIKKEHIRERIINNMFDDFSQHIPNYFTRFEDCHKELVKMIKNNVDIIGSSYRDSCFKFMKYCSKVMKIKNLTIKDYKKAYDMIGDLCNIIARAYLYGNINKTYDRKVPVVLKNDFVTIYRSICFKFRNKISHIKRYYDPEIDVMIFNSDKERIYVKNFFYKIISDKILIPIKFLERFDVHYINIKIGGRRTGLVSVSEYYLRKK